MKTAGLPSGVDTTPTVTERSSGAEDINLAKPLNTDRASDHGNRILPARTLETGCKRISMERTTPKLPPPPRNPQNRSAFSEELALTRRPSARITSAAIRLSSARPNRVVKGP